jgi:very-short-patch-repair endonuclease
MAAVLDAGAPAALSHLSGAGLWRLPGFRISPMEVTLLRGVRGHNGRLATAHRPRLLLPSHLTVVRGIPVSTLGRTLFDIAPRIHPERLEIVVDRVLGKSPGTLVALHRILDELAQKGRPGIRVMREILAIRPPGYVAPATGLELRFDHILIEAGEKPLSRQVDVGGHDWLGRVDFVDRDLRALFEIDSIAFHTTPLDLANDKERDTGMNAAGWITVERIAEFDIWYRPWKVVAQVRAARARACRALNTPSGTPIGYPATGSGCQNEELRV